MGSTAAVLLGGVAGFAAVLLAAYAVNRKKRRCSATVIVLSKGCKHGRAFAPSPNLAQLKAAIESNLQIAQARLFLAQDPDKSELIKDEQLSEAHTNSNLTCNGTLLLYATSDDSDTLPEAMLEAPPLQCFPSGPRPLPFIGHWCLFLGPHMDFSYNQHFNLFTPEKLAKWGDTIQVYYPRATGGKDLWQEVDPSLASSFISTCDPAVVAELQQRQGIFPKHWGRMEVERDICSFTGAGLFTSSTLDHNWETAHGLLPKGFNQLRIASYYPVILEKTQGFLRAWARVPQGAVIEGVSDWLTCMTADAVVSAALGLEMENVERKATGQLPHKFISAFRYGIKACMTNSTGNITVRGEFGTLAALNPFFDGAQALRDKYQAAIATTHEVVEELKESTRKGTIGGPGSLLRAMLEDISPTTGDYVSFSNIYGQIMNLMIAGHETTAATLGFTLYYIATHPEVQTKALTEIEQVLGDRSEPTAADIPKLVYIEACFREALRLHPPVQQISRDVAEDTTLLGRYVVRRGQRIDVNIISLGRREDQWGGKFGDPNLFNPDRFLPGAAEATGRHPQAFVPWGFGVRTCIGSQFALWEAKTFLAMLLRTFQLQVPGGYVLWPASEGGSSPVAHKLSLRISPRSSCSSSRNGSSEVPLLRKLSSAQPNLSSAGAPGRTELIRSGHSEAELVGESARGQTTATATAAAAPSEASHDTPLKILYGSNMGTCEELASQFAARAAAAGFATTVAPLDSLLQALGPKGSPGQGPAASCGLLGPGSGAVVVLTCTYNGQPPDNARAFAKWLGAAPEGLLLQVPYSVLGVGNSQWSATYQAFPTDLDQRLAAAGASRLAPLTTCDVDSTDWMETFEGWGLDLVKRLLEHFDFDFDWAAGDAEGGAGTPGEALAATGGLDKVNSLRLMEPQEPGAIMSWELLVDTVYGHERGPGRAVLATVLENTELQATTSSRSTRHVVLSFNSPAISYRPGDHLEVAACNSPALITAALSTLGLQGQERAEWLVPDSSCSRSNSSSSSSREENEEGGLPRARFGRANRVLAGGRGGCDGSMKRVVLSARDALGWLVDLSWVPTRRQVAELAAACPCPPEAARLREMASEDGYTLQVSSLKLTLVELLQQYRSLQLTLPQLYHLLPTMATRFYSISSSPAASAPGTCSITVGRVGFTTPTGRIHQGSASASTIAAAPVGGKLLVAVRQLQSSFHLPQNPATPLILVGPGTGIAPMMGFLQERASQAERGISPLGAAHLFFGCRNSQEDFLYRQQLEQYKQQGVLSGLHVAFSRAGPSKVYVQDQLMDQGQLVWKLLEAGAVVFVCGDARKMAPDVRAAFKHIAMDWGGFGGGEEVEVEDWFKGLVERLRYLEDVWAG